MSEVMYRNVFNNKKCNFGRLNAFLNIKGMFSYFVLKLYFEVAGHVDFEIVVHVGGLE